MSEDFRNIVDLTSYDFNHLKNLRNKIAHGDVPTTKYEGNLTYEITLQSKLLVILYCWSFKDLGIPERDCIQFLGNWLHPMIRSADLNKTTLDKTIGHYKFLPLNKRDFNNVTKVKFGAIILEYSDKGKKYKYRKDLEKITKSWYLGLSDGKPRSLDEYITLHVNTDNIHSLCYIGSVYVENGDQSHCTQGICILNPPSGLIDKSRYWEYNESENKWHQPFMDGE